MYNVNENELEARYYSMVTNPKIEGVFYGDELREGMKVLIIEDLRRADIGGDELEKPHTAVKALKYNRWCTVTKLREEKYTVVFTGLYDDGSRRVHSEGATEGWYVKLDSIPGEYFTDQRDREIEQAIDILRNHYGEKAPQWIQSFTKSLEEFYVTGKVTQQPHTTTSQVVVNFDPPR